MIAGPSLIQQNSVGSNQAKEFAGKMSNNYIGNKKDSGAVSNFSKPHKNSLVGPSYNSDTEDSKHQEHQEGLSKAIDEINREAKNIKFMCRQSSFDQL